MNEIQQQLPIAMTLWGATRVWRRQPIVSVEQDGDGVMIRWKQKRETRAALLYHEHGCTSERCTFHCMVFTIAGEGHERAAD